MEINLLGFIHRHLAISHLVLILYKHRCGDTHSYWSCVWEGCGGGGSASVGSATDHQCSRNSRPDRWLSNIPYTKCSLVVVGAKILIFSYHFIN